MQELLGRIARLDPTASLGLRVIACFDELVAGNVNTRALISAAAALAGCVCGFQQTTPRRVLRVDPRGNPAPEVVERSWPTATADDGLAVWLERDGAPLVNDAIILERLALSVRIRHGRAHDGDRSRDLGVLLDANRTLEERRTAAARLGLNAQSEYRVVVAPLFAVWTAHPGGPEDVLPSGFGPLHTIVVPAGTGAVAASPAGIGVGAPPEHLHRSYRTAITALRLCDPPRVATRSADDFGGLVALLADHTDDGHHPDATHIAHLLAHPWAESTVEALLQAGSMRHAARLAEVHHKTMQTRIDTIVATTGFNPLDGHGRTRLGIAYLVWRLRRSRVLELPPPSPPVAAAGPEPVRP